MQTSATSRMLLDNLPDFLKTEILMIFSYRAQRERQSVKLIHMSQYSCLGTTLVKY